MKATPVKPVENSRHRGQTGSHAEPEVQKSGRPLLLLRHALAAEVTETVKVAPAIYSIARSDRDPESISSVTENT